MAPPRAPRPLPSPPTSAHPALLAGALSVGLLGGPAACLKVPDDEINAPQERGAPSTAEEILDRYVEAMGGAEALRALTRRTVEAKIVLHPVEGCEEGDPACGDEAQEGSFLLQTTADGKMYRRMVIEDPAAQQGTARGRSMVSERGFDGTQGWEIQPSNPPLLLLEAEDQQVVGREDAMLHWYLDYSERGVNPEILSSRTVASDQGELTLDGLAWTIPGSAMPPRSYWFDRATGLLREEVEREGDEDNGSSRVIVYSDYRPVDGVQVPFKIEQLAQNGTQAQRIDLTVQRADHAEIPRPMFAVPELPVPDPAPDARLAALEDARADAEADPKDATAGITWARAAWIAGQFDEARKAAEATLKADPREPEALYLLGRVLTGFGDIRGARQAFQKAGAAGVSPQVIDFQLGILALRERDAASAARHFGRAGDARQAARWDAAGGKILQARWGGDGCTVTLPLLEGFVAPAIEVELEGEALRLLVDTSVPGVVIDQQRALKMLISTDAQSPLGPQGPVIGHGTVDALTLGDLELTNVPVDMYPPELIADVAMGRDLHGVIGGRVFEQGQLTIDPVAGELVLVRDHGRCRKALELRRSGHEVPFFLHEDHMIFVAATLNGARGLFLVNTAMRGAGLAATVGAFARAATPSPVVRADEPGAFVQVDSVKLGELELGPTRGAWGWAEQQSPDQFRVDGMIGIEAIGRRRWTVDFGTQRFFFGDEAAPATPATPAAQP